MPHRALLAQGNLSLNLPKQFSSEVSFGAKLNFSGLQTPYSPALVLPADRAMSDAPNQTQPNPNSLTFRDGRGQGGLAVVHMANGTHIHMGLVTHVGFLGLHG